MQTSSLRLLNQQGPPPKAGGAPWAFGKLRQQQQQSQPQQQQQQQSHKQAQQQQQQSGLPLVQDMSSMQTASQVSTADAAPVLSKPQGHILADHSHDPSEAQLCDQQSINRICARMEALEGASMRIEAKLDQILGCCHLMTGGMVP